MNKTRETLSSREEQGTRSMGKINYVKLNGEVIGEFKFSHRFFGEGFYMIYIRIPRLSKVCDELPIMVSDRLIDTTRNLTGKQVQVIGQYRSYNMHKDGKNKLLLFVFAKEFLVLIDDETPVSMANQIYLDGYICSRPKYRKTPLGREIADLLIAVNRPYGKSDYIPCIVWGRNARYVLDLNIGDNVQIGGRIQSREYNKQISDVKSEKRVAYEVSVSKIMKV